MPTTVKVSVRVEDGVMYVNDKACTLLTTMADEAIEQIGLGGHEAVAAVTYYLAFQLAMQDHLSPCQHSHFLETSASMLGDSYTKYRSILALQDLPANDQTQH
jgi:hypothetical protein